MSDFEKDVLGFIQVLHDDATQAEIRRHEHARQETLKRQQESTRLERARQIGKQAADLLTERGIPTIPILVRPTQATYSPTPVARQHVADGWHIFYKEYGDHYTDSNIPMNYSLRTDGTLDEFANGDRSLHMHAIKDPRPMFHRFECELLENDGFKKAVAGLIAGYGVLEFDHI